MQSVLRQEKKVQYYCSAENIPPNQSVHELRKLFKRLRSLLRFYQHVPGGNVQPLREEMRHFGRELSPLRESYVNICLFEDELRAKKLVPERKMREAAEKLHLRNRQLVGSTLSEHSVCKAIRQFFPGFEDQLIRAGGREVSKIQIVWEISQSYQNSFFHFNYLPPDPSADQWHAFRKKLKRLYYQLDFIRLLHPRYFKLKSEQLSIINDHLGYDHDLHVFSLELGKKEYPFSPDELYILENQIEHLRELNQIKLNARLKSFFSEPSGAFNEKLELLF